MSTHVTSLLKFDGVFSGVLFEKEVRETFKDKARKHDIIIDKNSKYLIWPELELLNPSTHLVCINPPFADEYENALEFFRPLLVDVMSKQSVFYISVKKSDKYPQNLCGKIVADFPVDRVKWQYNSATYPTFVTLYFFSDDDRHKFRQNIKSTQDFFVSGYSNIFKYIEGFYNNSMSPHVSVLMRSKNGDRKYMAAMGYDYAEYADFGTVGYNFSTKREVTVNESSFVTAPGDVLFTIFGPIELVAEKICILQKQSQNYEICYESQLEEYFSLSPSHLSQRSWDWLVSRPSPGKTMRSKYRHNTIVDICMALSFLDAPYYVLDIIDKLPLLRFAGRVEKVRIIEGVFSSIRKVLKNKNKL